MSEVASPALTLTLSRYFDAPPDRVTSFVGIGLFLATVGFSIGLGSVLAAQSRDLASVAAVMVAFGVGAALPLLLLGRLSRAMLLRWRGRMMQAATGGKLLLGGTSLAVRY